MFWLLPRCPAKACNRSIIPRKNATLSSGIFEYLNFPAQVGGHALVFARTVAKD